MRIVVVYLRLLQIRMTYRISLTVTQTVHWLVIKLRLDGGWLRC